MSNTAKVSISVAEPDLLSWAKDRAERTGVSLSSVFTEAVRLERQIEARGRVIELDRSRREAHGGRIGGARRRMGRPIGRERSSSS